MLGDVVVDAGRESGLLLQAALVARVAGEAGSAMTGATSRGGCSRLHLAALALVLLLRLAVDVFGVGRRRKVHAPASQRSAAAGTLSHASRTSTQAASKKAGHTRDGGWSAAGAPGVRRRARRRVRQVRPLRTTAGKREHAACSSKRGTDSRPSSTRSRRRACAGAPPCFALPPCGERPRRRCARGRLGTLS
jgi:hypothetical protein